MTCLQVRLRSRRNNPQPGDSREGVYTCEVEAEGIVSVGLYYSSKYCTLTSSSLCVMSYCVSSGTKLKCPDSGGVLIVEVS